MEMVKAVRNGGQTLIGGDPYSSGRGEIFYKKERKNWGLQI